MWTESALIYTTPKRMSSCPTRRFSSLTVIILGYIFPSQLLFNDIGAPTEANGVILAAQQGDVQSFQFWVRMLFVA